GLACVVGDEQRAAAQPGEEPARLTGQRDKRVGHPPELCGVTPTVDRLPAVSARAQQTRLPVTAAMGGGRGAADRDVPEVGVCGVDRLSPGVMAVEPLVKSLPCIAPVVRAGDPLSGGFVQAIGGERVREKLVGVAVSQAVVVDPGFTAIA